MHSVYLVRHGKSSLDGTESERGLDPEGEEHARYLGGRLESLSPPIKAIYTSPYRRAQLTIEPFAERTGLPVKFEDAFHEKVMSDGPVDDLKAARVKMWEDFSFRLPGGESCGQAQNRALDALARIRAAHPNEAVAVSGHGVDVRPRTREGDLSGQPR